jgi:hypothetical protein
MIQYFLTILSSIAQPPQGGDRTILQFYDVTAAGILK